MLGFRIRVYLLSMGEDPTLLVDSGLENGRRVSGPYDPYGFSHGRSEFFSRSPTWAPRSTRDRLCVWQRVTETGDRCIRKGQGLEPGTFVLPTGFSSSTYHWSRGLRTHSSPVLERVCGGVGGKSCTTYTSGPHDPIATQKSGLLVFMVDAFPSHETGLTSSKIIRKCEDFLPLCLSRPLDKRQRGFYLCFRLEEDFLSKSVPLKTVGPVLRDPYLSYLNHLGVTGTRPSFDAPGRVREDQVQETEPKGGPLPLGRFVQV